MERYSTSQQAPDVSAEERAFNEMVKRIRKLRWIGKEQEARQLQAALGESPPVFTGQLEPRSDLSGRIMMSRERAALPLSNLG